jgi:Rho-binding antiterminator
MEAYIPVNCEFHDHLEDFATLLKAVSLSYLDEAGQSQQRTAAITDVFARTGADWVTLSTGDLIRADRLIEVNGIRLDAFPPSCAL